MHGLLYKNKLYIHTINIIFRATAERIINKGLQGDVLTFFNVRRITIRMANKSHAPPLRPTHRFRSPGVFRPMMTFVTDL